MITSIAERAIRRFEWHNCSPGAVKRAAGLVRRMVNSGLNAQVIREIQTIRLQSTLSYVYERSPFYRGMFQRLQIKPDDIRTTGDLKKLPFTTSGDIRDWQQFLCVQPDQLSAVFTTSGTTGEPKRVYFTYREMQMLTNLYAVALRIRHPGALTGLIALPATHGLWIGSPSVHRAVERAGGLPLPVGAEDPSETLKWMRRFEPNFVFSSPSYMTALTREAEREGYRPKVDRVLTAGELLTSEHKCLLNEYWGAEVYDSYGSTEIGSAQTIAMPECTAFHINDLHLVTEIIDPETGEPAEEGEMVFTTLRREGMPLLRYRSGDRARWSECRCNLPLNAIKIAGRTDDMMVAGDMNLYGRIIVAAVGKVHGATGRVAIELAKKQLTDKMVLSVEGKSVRAEDVEQALFGAYPELEESIENGNILFEIRTGADLGSQLKDLKISDKRFEALKAVRRLSVFGF